MELNKIQSIGSWGKTADDLNQNFSKVKTALEQVKNATTRIKGYFSSSEELVAAFPSAYVGDIAYVGTTNPYQIYKWNGVNWERTEETGGEGRVELGDYYTRSDIDNMLEESDEMLYEHDYFLRGLNKTSLDYEYRMCSLGASTWYTSATNQRHIVIPVVSGDVLFLLPSINGLMGWLTDEYSEPTKAGGEIPYVPGTGRITLNENVEHRVVTPSGASYLCLVVVDGAGNTCEWSIKRIGLASIVKENSDKIESLGSTVRALSNVINEGSAVSVDLSESPVQNCTLGSTSWYDGASTGCEHKSIEVSSGYTKISLKPSNDAFIGFLTKNYSPPYTHGDTIPYVEGTGRTLVTGGVDNTVDIPAGTAYIAFSTLDGAGTSISYSNVYLLPSDGLLKRVEQVEESTNRLLKELNIPENAPKGIFGVMSYNIGGWYNGTAVSIPPTQSELYLPLQKEILDRYNPDFLLLQEYKDYVVEGGLTSDDFLSYYNLYATHGTTTYHGKAIASKTKVFDIEVKTFVNDDGVNRNFLKGYTYCNGRKVLLLSTHLSTEFDYASLEIDEIINEIKDEEYVVLGMDSNIDVLSEKGASVFQRITDAGLKFINNNVVTYPRLGTAIDNIIVSNNIVIRSVFADTQKSVLGDDADHYPLLAYLEIF